MKKDIYIIRNSVNDKVYIGQAADAAKRWLSHIYNAVYEHKTGKDTQVIHKAMIKYGIDKFHYELLEYQIENYDEREKYWIKTFGSLVPNGYNVSPGGNGVGVGIESPVSVFKDEAKLMKCIEEISSSNKTFANIAKKYGCSEEVISSINTGKRYKKDHLLYPLRNTDTRYSLDLVKQVRYSLKYELDLTLSDIAARYNMDRSQVSAINQGHAYYISSAKYPLRDKRKRDLSEAQLLLIVDDIQNSEMSMSEIAAKYNVSRAAVSGINYGINYHNEALEYPLRNASDPRNKAYNKFLDRDVIIDILKQLRGSDSISEIAKRFGVSTTTIHNINNGVCKKYVISGVDYPVRKFNKSPVSTIHA